MADYPIRAAAKLSGLPIDTLRAWERRYQAVQPRRSSRGRVYDEVDVKRLSLLRRAVESGHAIGQIAALADENLLELSTVPAPDIPSSSGFVEPLLAAVETLDYRVANQLLGRIAALVSPGEVVHEVILPAFQQVGERWGHGERSIAREHLLSASVRNLMGVLGRMQTPSSDAVMLFTTPAGELHEFGILAAAILAGNAGANVSYLGPNLPVDAITFAVRQSKAKVLVLGVTGSDKGNLRELIALAENVQPQTDIWVGGAGLGTLRKSLPARLQVLEDFAEFERRARVFATQRLM